MKTSFNISTFIVDLGEEDEAFVRWKCRGLNILTKQTKFSRREIRMLYQGFKQVKFISFFPDMSLSYSLLPIQTISTILFLLLFPGDVFHKCCATPQWSTLIAVA